ncbi:TPA: acyltransferase [Kluyvera ascorbata]|nr:acyltransferase [Kluyvera ascorbata]
MSGLQIKKRGELEAIRGMATLSVVFGHFFSSFSHAGDFNKFVYLIYSSLTNGGAAVVVFFVLSGLVLPLSFFRSGGNVKTIQVSILNRFPRLFFLVFVTVMGAYIAYALGFNYAKSAAELSGSNWLSSMGYPNADDYFKPNFITALWQSTFGVLLDNRGNFNVSLWTMAHELFGSFVTFGLAMVVYKAPMKVVLAISVVALVVLQFTAWRLTPFVVGTVISIYLFNKPDFSLKLPVSLVLIVVGLLLYRFHISSAPNLP